MHQVPDIYFDSERSSRARGPDGCGRSNDAMHFLKLFHETEKCYQPYNENRKRNAINPAMKSIQLSAASMFENI
jgi:hypothetical protein